jgi:hypothetical protein
VSTAVGGPQMTLPVWGGDYACLYSAILHGLPLLRRPDCSGAQRPGVTLNERLWELSQRRLKIGKGNNHVTLTTFGLVCLSAKFAS